MNDEHVICHRMHTPTGAWGWVTGPANAQGRQDARTFGWRIENAYSAAAIEQQAAKVEALEREVERLRAVARDLDVVLGRRLCDGLNASGQPRCMKLAEAEKDARRYRWLRENNHMNRFDSRPVPYAVTSIYWKVGRHQARTMPGDRLDAAIDAAMQPVRIDHGRSGEGEHA